MSILELASIVALVSSAVSGLCFGYAAIVKAKAWRTWAERCDPKGMFNGPAVRRRVITDRR